LKYTMRIFLTLLILLIFLPSGASAAGNDPVLTSIGHIDTDVVMLSADTREVVLAVPYSYPGSSVDLKNGLSITYDDNLYRSVVAEPASAAVVDGGAVAVTVSFHNIDDEPEAEKSETVYYVRVFRGEAVPARFSGSITKTVEVGNTLSFTQDEFTSLYTRNDGEDLGYIKIKGSNLVAGTLMMGGNVYEFSTPIEPASLSLLSFDADACGRVSYDIEAYSSVSHELIGTAILTINVYSRPEIEGDVSKQIYVGGTHTFSASDFLNSCELYGMSLLTVSITPGETACGAWYFNSVQISGDKEIPASDISKLSFTALSAGTASFTWSVSNAAGYSSDGSGTIEVSSATLSLSTYTAPSSVKKGATWTVSASHFGYSPSSAGLRYIKILSIPANTDGYLYLTTALSKNDTCGYPAIGANTPLTAGAIIPYSYIQYLRLSTKPAATGTIVSFTWSATSDIVISSAAWADPASYTVKFVSAGTVNYTTYVNAPVKLSAADFSAQYTSSTGGSLYYVLFTPPASTQGALYSNYDLAASKGTNVSAATKYYPGASPNISSLTFVPYKDYSGTVTITYKAYNTAGEYVTGDLVIVINGSGGGTVVYVTDKNSALQVDAADFNTSFQNATGRGLYYVKFSLPSTSTGKLYYNYTSSYNYDSTVSSSQKYYVLSSPYLSYVSFVPREDYTGTVIISYTAYDESGGAYSGKLIIFVVDSPAGIVSYTSAVNGFVCLDGDDFADEFISVTGSVLSYVKFTLPASTSGALYSDYSADTASGTKVAAATKYYNGSNPDISNITFVPAKDFVGEVVIKYTVYSSSDVPYDGKLKITVGEAGSGTVSYATEMGTAVTFAARDFSSKFYANTGGSTLSYVTFTLPSSSCGRLYYGYNSPANYNSLVSAGNKYYVGSNPNISSVSFVPASGYTGSFTIPYTGYTSDGTGYYGKIRITVGGDGEHSVRYETASGGYAQFSSYDFRNAFSKATGSTLYYVMFDLPSVTKGTLYYGYTSAASYASTVSASTKYYASATPNISNICFVPYSGFKGTVTISYDAYDVSGESYEGYVIISVGGGSVGTVLYSTEKNVPVTFDAYDFNEALLEEEGSSLSYVKFALPSPVYGTLYYGYTSPSSFVSKVSASTKYYRASSPLLSDVSFVPNKDFTGSVTITYTAYTSGGTSYTGEVVINVRRSDTVPFTDVGEDYVWASDSISYLKDKGIVTGTGGGLFQPADSISRGDFVLMVCRAFELTGGSNAFPDVPSGSYYYDAIAAAKSRGIVEGIEGKFYPTSPLTRQDAMVIIDRALNSVGAGLHAANAGVLSNFSDADEVSGYALEATAKLVKAGVITGRNGALYPRDMISRAEMAVILHRILLLTDK
jgi:hypothetical protein